MSALEANMKTSNLQIIFVVLTLLMAANAFSEANPQASKASGKTFAIYPMKMGMPKDGGCMDYYGECALLLADKPAMTIKNVSYRIIHDEKPGFVIQLSKQEQSALKKVSKENVGKQLAIVYNQTIIHAPKVRMAIESEQLKMTFCNKRNFNVVLASLQNTLEENFKDAYDCGCSKDK